MTATTTRHQVWCNAHHEADDPRDNDWCESSHTIIRTLDGDVELWLRMDIDSGGSQIIAGGLPDMTADEARSLARRLLHLADTTTTSTTPSGHAGPTIRTMREAMCLTQRELAQRAEVSASYLGKVERYQVSPSRGWLHDVSTTLGQWMAEYHREANEMARLRGIYRSTPTA